MKRLAFATVLAVLLAGCGGQQTRTSASAPPARAPAQAAAKPVPQKAPAPAPASAASHAVADPGEAVWHLRAGLNVAALSCRGKGRAPVAGSYSRLLTKHRALLASAYAAEQRRYGKGLDRHLTQVYNRFALQRLPERFCTDAAAAAREAAALDSPTLSAQARRLLSGLS